MNLGPVLYADGQYCIKLSALGTTSGLRGGGAVRVLKPLFKGFNPLPTQRVPPFVLFWDIHFWLIGPNFFLNASSAPNYTNFEGEARDKKKQSNLLVKIFRKVCKNTFLACFFLNCLQRRKFGQKRVLSKNAGKLFDFFSKILPPLRNFKSNSARDSSRSKNTKKKP